MARRRRRAALRGWGIFLGLVASFAIIAVLIELLRSFWWAFLMAGTVIAIAWIITRRGDDVPMRATLAPRSARAPAQPVFPPLASPAPPTPFHTVPTLRGELMRSRAEARIADFLHRRGIVYDYEPTISGFRPDFYVPAWNLVIEYWGIDTPEYRERREVKTRAYFSNGYKLVSLESKDWPNLEQELARKLYYFDQGISRVPA